MQELMTLRQTAQRIGVSYDRLWYACKTHQLSAQYQSEGTRLFTCEDTEKAKEYFARKEKEGNHKCYLQPEVLDRVAADVDAIRQKRIEPDIY
jgi:hypothetical protein